MDDQEAERPEVSPKAASSSRWVRFVTWLRSFGWKGRLVGLAGLITTLAAFFSILDVLSGPLIDGCRNVGMCDSPTPLPTSPPLHMKGTLSNVEFFAQYTLGEVYENQNRTVPDDLSHLQDWPGRVITYRVEFQGLAGSTCLVHWTLYDAETMRRIPHGMGIWPTIDARAFPNGEWIVDRQQMDGAVGEIWIPYVASGEFLVEIELTLESSGLHLDRVNTSFVVSPDDVPTPVGSAPTHTTAALTPARMNMRLYGSVSRLSGRRSNGANSGSLRPQSHVMGPKQRASGFTWVWAAHHPTV